MSTLKKLQSTLEALNTERAQVAGAGWFLQHCWLVQVKPGGTARTNCKYWQVRSRQPMFDGKTLKHLKPNEVEDYRVAIQRGRQLKHIDRQIEKLQQQLAQLTLTTDSLRAASESSSAAHKPPLQIPILPTGDLQQAMKEQLLNQVKFTNLAEQERIVTEVLANSQALRASLRQAVARSKQLGVRNIDLRKKF
ncbi:hypothetical protein WA1_16935 [Scytonema hofmannii PCC 7110]|uniref:Uncharacterized protein n=1 Tax=Scytonema hofmannii PCC 7110 TaxID=128403 RepID=A0A139XAK2_9CYAN|nr:hypothetical protein [Scytonema hofmannii]KYC41720.1 hypothetical protein WA1_16935 [Scytonema hofmannii PCC 7110]